MNKKISLGAAIAYMAIVAAITFSLTNIYSQNAFNSMMKNMDEREATYDKLAEIDLAVRDNYYGTLDNDLLLSSTAAGYIAGLGDPDSKYLTPKEYEEYTKVESGKYVGIGVVTELSEDGYIRLKTVYPESPAEFAGLHAGDIIISIDGKTANAENYSTLSGGLKGEAGTKVTLVKRLDNSETTLELTRRDVDIPTVQSEVLAGNTGYIRFSGITQATSAQLEKTIKQLTDNGVTSLILDLRGIKSTNMKHITDMLDPLLPEGDIAYTKYKDGSKKSLGTSDAVSVSLPMTVLADDGTQGTPELFVQAIKEQPAGKFVGLSTAGHGNLQEDFKLKDGSAVLLTTAIYTSASGKSYDKTGVTPDYEVKLGNSEEEKAAFIGNVDTDPQLRKAMEISAAAVAKADAAASSGSSSSAASLSK
ncbi:MAG: S41 family peptidase [Angelakisella sp.]